MAISSAKTERPVPGLTLTRATPDHAAGVFSLLNDNDIARMLARVPWPLSFTDVESHLGRADETGVEDHVVFDGATLVGCVSLKAPGTGKPPRKMPRLGYWIGRPFWGRGYGTTAVALLCAMAFERHEGAHLGAGVFHDNAASRSLLEKLGFAEAGSYPTFSVARGVEVPTFDMQLTRAAWEEGRV